MLNYIILGIVQGLTEFLPVSSSAHLVFAQRLLGMNGNELEITIVLHLGTLLALIIFFFRDIFKILRDTKLLSLVAVATVITGIIGVSGRDFFKSMFLLPKVASLALVVTGIVLLFTKRFNDRQRKELSIKDASVFGLAQGIAVIPGISRSGSTISCLILRGIDQETAFRFSMLASIPVIIGAAIMEAGDIGFVLGGEFKLFAIGFIFSFITGVLALWILKIVLKRAKLFYFGYYCIIVAVITLLFMK